MQDTFHKHLAEALGAAPTAAAANGVIDLMQASDPEMGRWMLPLAIQQASSRFDTPLFGVLHKRGLLDHDFVADAIARFAAIHCNRPLIEDWRAHPQAQKMASGKRGVDVLSGIIGSGSKELQREHVLAHLIHPDLAWPQQTLDRMLRQVLEVSSMRDKSRHACIGLLLGAGADPTYMPSDTPKPRHAAFIIAHSQLRDPATAPKLIEQLHRSLHWPKVVELSEKGKSMPHLLASLAYCKQMEEGLDKAPQRWWDGDPYGLLSLVINRAHREPALLIGMCARARQHGLHRGLPQEIAPRVFMALFQSCGKEASKVEARANFWGTTAVRMEHLWPDGNVWPDLCRLAREFELSSGDHATPEQREAFAQATALTLSTPAPQAKARRRTL